MRTVNGGGDQLARGASRVQFKPAEGITDKKWEDIFSDFDPEAFKNAPNQSRQRTEDGSGDADSESTGVSGAESSATESEPITR